MPKPASGSKCTGSQYTSKEYQALLSAWGIEVSMSRKGDCSDNALMESFFATLKGECTDRQHWASHSQACQAIFECVEVFYNRQRGHSSLDYLSPVSYEQLRVSLPSFLALQKRGKPNLYQECLVRTASAERPIHERSGNT